MNLASDLANLRTTKPRTYEQWRAIASPEEVQQVNDAILDRTLPANSLSVVLRKNGIPVTRETILAIRATNG